MAHDIFISYSTADQAWAESALQLFESQGFSCWMAPRDIRPGSTWAAEIVHGISNARVMMLLLSSASNQSRQVAREVQLADSSQLRIVPVLLEAVKPEGDFVYFLSNTQWLTALGGNAADHSKTLLAAVGEALNASPQKPGSSAAAQSAPPPLRETPPRPEPAIQASSLASPTPAASPTSRALSQTVRRILLLNVPRRRVTWIPRILFYLLVLEAVVYPLLYPRDADLGSFFGGILLFAIPLYISAVFLERSRVRPDRGGDS